MSTKINLAPVSSIIFAGAINVKFVQLLRPFPIFKLFNAKCNAVVQFEVDNE